MKNIDNSDYNISRWMAEFSNAGMEQAFQKHVQPLITRQLRFALLVWAVLLLLFAIPDYIIIGTIRPFYYLLTYRIVITIALLILFFIITPETSIFKITYPVTLVVVAGFTGFMLFFVYRADSTPLVKGVLIVQIIGLLMFVPIRFVFAFLSSIYAVLITLVTLYVLGDSIIRLIAVLVLFLLPIMVGAITAIRFAILQREQFAMLTEQQLAAEALRKSEKGLANAQARAHLGSWEVDYVKKIITSSTELYRIFGVSPEAAREVNEKLFLEIVHPDDKALMMNELDKILNEKKSFKSEYRIIRHTDKAVRWVESYFDPLSDTEGNFIGVEGTALDITERKLAEEQIKELLKEKELLLKEVHHRVKNNMNTMISLLSLQAENMKDSEAASALLDAGGRLRSMGVLYDRLYREESFTEMSIKDYLSPLVDEIMAMFSVKTEIKTVKNINDYVLHYDVLAPIGIMTNEILTNTVKHAFHGRERGQINISFSVSDGQAVLIIQDDGIGIPETFDLQNSSGLGLQLIDMLARQINGEVTLDRRNGTKFTLEFNV